MHVWICLYEFKYFCICVWGLKKLANHYTTSRFPFVCVYACVSISLCMCENVYVWASVYEYACVSLWVGCLCKHLFVHVLACEWVYICEYVSMYVRIYVFVYMFVWVCLCIYISVCMCVWVSVSMSLFMCMCVSMSLCLCEYV